MSELDTITKNLAYATAQLEAWKQQRDAAVEQLARLHAAGDAPTKFDAYGYAFALQSGRVSSVFDAHGKSELADLRATLLEQGHGTESHGKPYWVLRKSKPTTNNEAA
jgi:hypothetical protein